MISRVKGLRIIQHVSRYQPDYDQGPVFISEEARQSGVGFHYDLIAWRGLDLTDSIVIEFQFPRDRTLDQVRYGLMKSRARCDACRRHSGTE